MEKKQADISVLRFPECVRVRPGMYLNSPDHCVFEIVDNSVDEFGAGNCNVITTAIIGDEVIVEDNGSGIPTDLSDDPEYKGLSKAEVAYTVLHAGGKFNSEGGYKTSTGGMNGVGASCVNATSESCKLIIRSAGKSQAIEFAKGVTTKHLYDTGEKVEKNKTGTEVHFVLDEEIWGEQWYDFGHIKRRLRQLAYLNPGLTMNLYFDSLSKDGKEIKLDESYNYLEGVKEYINEITKSKTQLITPERVAVVKDVMIKKNKRPITIDFAMVYTDGFSSDLKSFVNNIATEYGGDHETGFKIGIYSAIQRYAVENGFIKDPKQIESDDCREGMTAILSVKMKDPNFEGQGKSKLRMSEIRAAIKEATEEFLYDYLEQDKNRAGVILDKVLRAAKARNAARRAREAARGIKSIDSGVAEGLADCSCKDPSKCMIYLVEGDSAGGSAKQARDRKIQAILPVFGKVLNAEKTSYDKVYKSMKILEMVKALKCGIGEEFNIDKLRYHKIIIMSDADVDGGHIQCLHMAFFYRYLKPIIENGYLYAACPPLFKVTKKSGKKEEVTYLYTKEELDAFDTEGCSVQRYKGLGEMNPEQLWETTMNPETCRMLQITIDDCEAAEESLAVCMGSNVEARKKFILECA